MPTASTAQNRNTTGTPVTTRRATTKNPLADPSINPLTATRASASKKRKQAGDGAPVLDEQTNTPRAKKEAAAAQPAATDGQSETHGALLMSWQVKLEVALAKMAAEKEALEKRLADGDAEPVAGGAELQKAMRLHTSQRKHKIRPGDWTRYQLGARVVADTGPGQSQSVDLLSSGAQPLPNPHSLSQ